MDSPSPSLSLDEQLVNEVKKGQTANFNSIQVLLDQKADVNTRDTDDCPLLFRSIGCECSEKIIKLLIEKKADVNAVPNDSETPLQKAISRSRIIIVEDLLKAGADVEEKGGTFQNQNEKNYQPPLMFAVQNDRNNVIPILLKYNAIVYDGAYKLMKEKKMDQVVRPREGQETRFFENLEVADYNDVCAIYRQEKNLPKRLKQVRWEKDGKDYTAHQFIDFWYRHHLQKARQTGDYYKAWKLKEIQDILEDPSSRVKAYWFLQSVYLYDFFASIFGSAVGLVAYKMGLGEYVMKSLNFIISKASLPPLANLFDASLGFPKKTPITFGHILFALVGNILGYALLDSVRKYSDPEADVVSRIAQGIPLVGKLLKKFDMFPRPRERPVPTTPTTNPTDRTFPH